MRPRAAASGMAGVFGRNSFALLALALLLFGHARDARAAATPPDTMTYQGFLVDGNGNPLAPTTPQNYPVIFRIYAVSSGAGASLWSEQQIVTVDKGNFSVLLGEGTPVGGEARPALSSVFAGNTASDRYISVSVTISGNTMEILPRLRLEPAPYSFLATSATSLVQPNGSPFINFDGGQVNLAGNVGIGTPAAGKRLQIGDANTVNSEGMIRLVSRSGTGGANRAWDIGVPETDETVTGIGYSFVIDDLQKPGTEFMVQWGSGNVGIGTTTPARRLHVNGADTVMGRFDSSHAAGTWLSLGNSSVGGRYWQLISSGSGNGEGAGKLLIGSGATDGGSGIKMTLQDNGNVGIGTTAPAAPLDIASSGTWRPLSVRGNGGTDMVVMGNLSGTASIGGHNGAGNLWANLSLNPGGGNVGIGTTTPSGRLSLGGGDIAQKFVLWDGGSAGNTMGLGVGPGQFRLYLNPDSSRFTFLDAPNGNDLLNIWDSGAFNFGLGGTPATLNVNHGGFSDSTVTIAPAAGDTWGLVLTGGGALKPGGGSWGAFSDKRLKTVLGDFKAGLDQITQLKTVRYRYKDDPSRGLDSKTEHFGFVAQEVEPVIPEAVSKMSDGALVLNMDLIYLASVNAIKQLHAEVTALQTEKATLEKRLAALENLVNKLANSRAADNQAAPGLSQPAATASGSDR